MSEVVQVTVAAEQKNERIDKFVAGINNDPFTAFPFTVTTSSLIHCCTCVRDHS